MRDPLLSRDFILCTFITFAYTVMFFMTYTGMTAFVISEFDTDSAMAAVAVSIFVVGDLIARLLSGRIIDRFGMRNSAVLALVLSTGLSLLYFVVGDVASLFVLRLVHGMSYGLMGTAISTKVAKSVPSERMGEGMGYYMLSVSIGSALGPMVSMMLDDDGSFTDIFAIGFAMSLMALVLSLMLSRDTAARTGSTDGPKGLVERSSLPISLVVLVFFFSYAGVLSFMSPYGDEIGLGQYATYFFLVLSISTLLSRAFLGKLYDVRGENVLMIPSFLLFIAGMVLLSTTENGWLLLLSGGMMGVNVALMTSVGSAIAIKLADPDRTAVAISTFNIFVDLAYVLGPLMHGVLVDSIGYRDSYMMMAGMAAVALVMYYLLHGRLVTSGRIQKGSIRRTDDG